jgi:hypothetical protein
MKSKPLLVIFLVCFSLFLFLGIKASQSLFSDQEIPSGRVVSAVSPAQTNQYQAGPQPFTVIVLVDDLSSLNPILEGVWLSRADQQASSRFFFPIFPSQAEDGVQRDLNLRGAFWFEEPYQPSRQFLTILEDRNLAWGQMLFLDFAALEEIGILLSEINPTYEPLNSIGLAGLSYTVENRLLAQTNQALLINEICQQLPLPGQNELMQRFLEGFSTHLFVVEITPLDYYQSWQSTGFCYFPTMELPLE